MHRNHGYIQYVLCALYNPNSTPEPLGVYTYVCAKLKPTLQNHIHCVIFLGFDMFKTVGL